jgi:septal ring factor EnvC (AmiA/AmiB activator)
VTVAGPPTAELDKRINELTSRLQNGLDRLTVVEQAYELRLQELEADATDAAKTRKELEAKVNDQAQKIARLEERLEAAAKLLEEKERRIEQRFDERTRALEKQSDRGWQLWLAALGFGFGLLSLLVTAALQLKK